WKYLGWLISDSHVRPQKALLQLDLHTLHDVQRFIGDIQWLRPIVGITKEELDELRPLLKDNDPAMP
ncbi:POK18 protein, partial [Piaya cayana]|nr:POK18 protein [Piaya cayana]